MTRTLRGAWSRRWTLAPLLALTVVVVAGTVTVVSFAEAAGTDRLLALPLLLLGLVALPATARELALARRGEIALARLRGLQAGELSALMATEPLLVLVVGAAGGLGLGAVGGRLAAATWADGSAGLGLAALLSGGAIVVVGLVVTVLGMAGTLGEPLASR